ncbi:hypothetical protein [Amycolatopsis benzoatilytica]|uniref:hypothetical protein n=1 Tax=Amycolatopsis benzoatilytica TaxID=346045 RepID=UPI00037BAB05|nr:hypothetical protein [Amycolatopsis benzoatilytica]
MISNSKFLKAGTGLPVCMAPTAPRPGTGVSTVAHVDGTRRRIDGLRLIEGNGTPAGIALATAVVAAYPQVDADLPTIKQFRVPLSIRERSS